MLKSERVSSKKASCEEIATPLSLVLLGLESEVRSKIKMQIRLSKVPLLQAQAEANDYFGLKNFLSKIMVPIGKTAPTQE